MQELLTVRHSVFIVGVACTGKTQIWKTLLNTYVQQDRKPIAFDLNPKCVSNSELFGCINSATREWKDGLLSSLIRIQAILLVFFVSDTIIMIMIMLIIMIVIDQAQYANDNPKWIMIDGDIDPLWIESLNTVMDDNKVHIRPN